MPHTLLNELVTMTTHLIRFRSTADQPAQLTAAVDYVARYLKAIPGVQVYRSERNDKPSLVATMSNTRSPQIMLNGHLDVVAANPDQFEPEVRENRLYGRGSQDMKGSVAVLMRLMKNLAQQDPRPDIGLQIVSDEEIGGAHGTGLLVQDDWRCNFFIAAEPTDLNICHEQKGGIWLKLQLPGTTAHASRPWDGENPVVALGKGLEALQRKFPPVEYSEWKTTAVPTLVRSAEGAPNQIPAHVNLALDVRYTDEYTPDTLVEAIQTCFPTAEILDRKHVSPLRTSPDAPAVQQLAEVTEQVYGTAPKVYREHFASDARFYSDIGIPSVCFGPVGQGLHSDNEWVDIESLVQFYHVLRAYICQEAGTC
jgi:succinyl-diaminopimelate desuccinylase